MDSNKSKEHVFAQGLCGKKLFIIYVLGSIFGCYYEQILNFFRHLISDGTIFWETRRGVIYGPFSPIYGAGAVLMCYFLLRKKRSDLETFSLSALIGGGFEYMISFLQETVTHTTSWDYSNMFLNINGRTTIPYIVVWGLLGLLLVKFVYPFISDQIEKISVDIGNKCFKVLVVFMCLNMFVSWTAIIRQTLRRENIPPYTPMGKIYDKYYTDERLYRAFPNMRFR